MSHNTDETVKLDRILKTQISVNYKELLVSFSTFAHQNFDF